MFVNKERLFHAAAGVSQPADGRSRNFCKLCHNPSRLYRRKEGITTHQADVAIRDSTGVQVVDTQVADALLRTALAVKLLGA